MGSNRVSDSSEKVPENAHQVVSKGPPPEEKVAIRRRTLIILAFWSILALLGVPMWWKTTSIHRAALPIADMLAWSDGQASTVSFPVRIGVRASREMSHDILNVTKEVESLLNSSPSHGRFRPHFQLHAKDTNEDDLTISFQQSATSDGQLSGKVKPQSTLLEIDVPSRAGLSATELRRSVSQLLIEQISMMFQPMRNGRSPGPASVAGLDLVFNSTTGHAAKYAPAYHLTFSLLTPGALPLDWDIQEAISSSIAPLLEVMGTFSNFSIDTQAQPFSQLASSVQPTFSESRQAWELQPEDIGGFINAAEWPLSPSIGAAPTLHFVIYVPDVAQTPLVVSGNGNEDGSNIVSWLVPQWGGIIILNRDSNARKSPILSAKDLEHPMLTFGSHLLSLLGLPDQPKESLPLQLRSLRRALTITLMSSASGTMGALARLALSMPSIAIPESVSSSTLSCIAHLQESYTAMSGGNFRLAFHHARAAEIDAEQAFFEPSMVGQVYFPDEHKVAVYLPLLGPVAVPLMLGLVGELRRMLARRKG